MQQNIHRGCGLPCEDEAQVVLGPLRVGAVGVDHQRGHAAAVGHGRVLFKPGYRHHGKVGEGSAVSRPVGQHIFARRLREEDGGLLRTRINIIFNGLQAETLALSDVACPAQLVQRFTQAWPAKVQRRVRRIVLLDIVPHHGAHKTWIPLPAAHEGVLGVLVGPFLKADKQVHQLPVGIGQRRIGEVPAEHVHVDAPAVDEKAGGHGAQHALFVAKGSLCPRVHVLHSLADVGLPVQRGGIILVQQGGEVGVHRQFAEVIRLGLGQHLGHHIGGLHVLLGQQYLGVGMRLAVGIQRRLPPARAQRQLEIALVAPLSHGQHAQSIAQQGIAPVRQHKGTPSPEILALQDGARCQPAARAGQVYAVGISQVDDVPLAIPGQAAHLLEAAGGQRDGQILHAAIRQVEGAELIDLVACHLHLAQQQRLPGLVGCEVLHQRQLGAERLSRLQVEYRYILLVRHGLLRIPIRGQHQHVSLREGRCYLIQDVRTGHGAAQVQLHLAPAHPLWRHLARQAGVQVDGIGLVPTREQQVRVFIQLRTLGLRPLGIGAFPLRLGQLAVDRRLRVTRLPAQHGLLVAVQGTKNVARQNHLAGRLIAPQGGPGQFLRHHLGRERNHRFCHPHHGQQAQAEQQQQASFHPILLSATGHSPARLYVYSARQAKKLRHAANCPRQMTSLRIESEQITAAG